MNLIPRIDVKRAGRGGFAACKKGGVWRLQTFVFVFTVLLLGCAQNNREMLQSSPSIVVERSATSPIEDLLPIYFQYESSSLSWHQLVSPDEPLQNYVDWLKARPSLKVVLEGHGDMREKWEHSVSRARAVRDYLVAAGVQPGRLIVIGRGNDYPVSPGENEMAWAQNRRVEFLTMP